jgi:hypothetical protein
MSSTRSAAADREYNELGIEMESAVATVAVTGLRRLNSTAEVGIAVSTLGHSNDRCGLETVRCASPTDQTRRAEKSMNCDLLLYWMSQVGEGSWSGFRKAILELASDSLDQAGLARRLRVAFSDLGHADFFIDGTQRWRVLPSMLVGLGAEEPAAVLCGARSPELVESLKVAAEASGCQFLTTDMEESASRISVRGCESDIGRVADRIHVSFVPSASNGLLNAIESIASQIENAPHVQRPEKWDEESFDLSTRSWVKGLQPHAACKFTPLYGSSKFLLHRRRERFLDLTKRDAVYASAMVQGVKLLGYNEEGGVLTAPIGAPLPEKLARAACLCSGMKAVIEAESFTYCGVPLDIASGIFVAAGQQSPFNVQFVQPLRSDRG